MEPSKRKLRYSRAGILQPDDVDGRSRYARRHRRLCDQFAEELGHPPSEIERSEIRLAVRLLMRSETEVDADLGVRLASESRRVLAGLKATAAKGKPAGPNLADHLRDRYGVANAEAGGA